MRCVEVRLTTNAAGGGTTQSVPMRGRIVQVRIPAASALTVGGSADVKITRASDGGTVADLTNVATAGIDFAPYVPFVTVTGGSTSFATGQGPIPGGGYPVDGHLNIAVLQGALSVTTPTPVFVYVEGDN